MNQQTKTVSEINPNMKCGHEIYHYELEKEGGIVFIRWKCVEGCLTEWGTVGEAPLWDELEIEKE